MKFPSQLALPYSGGIDTSHGPSTAEPHVCTQPRLSFNIKEGGSCVPCLPRRRWSSSKRRLFLVRREACLFSMRSPPRVYLTKTINTHMLNCNNTIMTHWEEHQNTLYVSRKEGRLPLNQPDPCTLISQTDSCYKRYLSRIRVGYLLG